MSVSLFPGVAIRKRRVATAAITGPGQRIILDIPKENIQLEHKILVSVSMANAGAPTAVDPNRIGKLFSSILVRVSGPQGGELFNCSGLVASLVGAVNERPPVVIGALAAPQTAIFEIELHHENNEMLRGLMTAINGDNATGITIELTTAALADIRSIAGGPYTAAAAFTTMTGTVEVVVDEAAPRTLAGVQGVAVSRHFLRESFQAFAGAAPIQIQLQVGNTTRGILISAETAAGIGSDAIFDNVQLQIGGETILDLSYNAARLATAQNTEIDGMGLVYIPFPMGDDEAGFLNLYDTNQAFLVLNAIAAGQVRVGQDYSQGIING